MENRMVLCSQRAEVVSLAVPHQETCSPATPLAQRMVMRLLPVPRAYLQSIGRLYWVPYPTDGSATRDRVQATPSRTATPLCED
jgi:hypothetical protein